MYRRKKGKDNEFDRNVCAFCGKPSDEKKCGKFFVSKCHGFAVHQYCMFFSAALPQNGQDHEGFEGFLEQDVLKEIRRATRLRCCLCLKKGASAGCCDPNCRRGFHFTCGVDEKYLFQFYGQFRAFCFDHRPSQKTTSYPLMKSPCPICLESVKCRASANILTTPCCKDVWLHRTCVQEQALASGYFFRCAVCNDTEKFVEEMKRMGIYVPDRDAAWEDGNNFAELLEKYSRCDNTPCRCPMGRKFSADSGQWELVLCSSCGQYGTHVGCKSWGTLPPSLLCPTCRPAHECDDNDKITTRTAGHLTTDPGGGVAISPVARKGIARSRRKRQNMESDEDSDDISTVLNGLKRQAQDDVLNSDTSFFVQRAIAAGNAVIENSGRKRLKTSQSAIANSVPSDFGSTRKRKACDASRKSSEESDDDIVITKYVPGRKTCEICPKCHRRKPMNTWSPAEAPQKAFPTGSTSTVGKSSGSTCTITKTDMERKEAGYESENFEKTARGKCDTASTTVKVADYEVLELAAKHTSKSSVLLLPSEEELGKNEETLKGNYAKISKSDFILNDNNENELHRTPGNAVKPPSFWLSSVERIFQFLNPRSGPETNEDNICETGVRKMSESVREMPEDLRGLSESTRQVSESSPNSDLQSIRVDDKVSGGSGRKSGCPRRRGNATNGASATAGEKSESCLSTSETNSKHAGQVPECSSTSPSKFSNSPTNSGGEKLSSRNGDTDTNKDFKFLTKKAVLEAAIDRAKELKTSGKELKNRCLTSC